MSRDNNRPEYATGVTEEHRPEASSHSTSNAIVSDRRPSASRAAEGTSRRGNGPTNRRARANQLPLSEHFNEPIRPHVWYSKRRAWSRVQLDQERREFFETRVTGRPEVWAALSAAISMMRAGDLTTAQTIIDAAGVTVPTGDLCEGCYDEQGVLYRLPQCIVSDPENMVESGSIDDTANNDDSDGKLAGDDSSGDELISDEVERRREEKGKTSERDLIKVKARLSDGSGTDIVVSVGKTQSVGFIARKIQQEAGVCLFQVPW